MAFGQPYIRTMIDIINHKSVYNNVFKVNIIYDYNFITRNYIFNSYLFALILIYFVFFF